MVEMGYTVTPSRIFVRSAFGEIGTTTVRPAEVATAILSDGGRLDGQFSQSLSHVHPEEVPDLTDLAAAYAHRFETLDGCGDGRTPRIRPDAQPSLSPGLGSPR